jgi:hypothetical protein
MKFSVASLVSGAVLIAAPILSYTYQIHVIAGIASTVMNSSGSVQFPDAPTIWYAISGVAGTALLILGGTIELLEIRAASLKRTQSA